MTFRKNLGFNQKQYDFSHLYVNLIVLLNSKNFIAILFYMTD